MDSYVRKVNLVGQNEDEDDAALDDIQGNEEENENEMNDSLGEVEPVKLNAQAPPQQLAKRPDLNKEYAEIQSSLSWLSGLEDSAEMKSKADSKDGLMTAVRTSVNAIISWRNEKGSVSLLGGLLQTADSACQDYISKKKPFFSKGKKRKQKVIDTKSRINALQSKLDSATTIYSMEETFNTSADSSKQSTEVNRLIRAGKGKEKFLKDFEASRQEGSGNDRYGRMDQDATSLAYGFAYEQDEYFDKYDGWNTNRRQVDMTTIRLASRMAAGGQGDAKTIESWLNMFSNEDMGKYEFKSLADLIDGDLERKYTYIETAAAAKKLVPKYVEAVKQGTKGLKYNSLNTLANVCAKMNILTALGDVMRPVIELVRSGNSEKLSKLHGSFDKIKFDGDELPFLMQNADDFIKDPDIKELYKQIYAVRTALESKGLSMGATMTSWHWKFLTSTIQELNGMGLK